MTRSMPAARLRGWIVPLTILLASLPALSCAPPDDRKQAAEGPIRLVDLYPSAEVESPGAPVAGDVYALEWRLEDGAANGWRAARDVAELRLEDGSLRGRTRSPMPILYAAATPALAHPDRLHAIEIRLKASAGSTLRLSLRGPDAAGPEAAIAEAPFRPWLYQTPILASGEFHTYRLRSPYPDFSPGIHHVLLQPTDAPDATFAIDYVRFIFQREHLARLSSGVAWQDLAAIFRETLIARGGETIRFATRLGDDPRLRLAVGTPQPRPVTFRVGVQPRDGGDGLSTRRTVTTPDRWEDLALDLGPLAGREVTVELALDADGDGALGFWGAPAIWHPRGAVANGRPTPRGVVLIVVDTLRADHLASYGYDRDTAPNLQRLAEEGVSFADCVAQATWTKASMASILTSLYVSSHGVKALDDRLPAAAATLAERYRDTGHATLSLSSNVFFGAYSNLHQGFEIFHESPSLADPHSSKTARELGDRLLGWLERNHDLPFFVTHHVFDPHSPYEPYTPYDALWADPARRETHRRQVEEVRRHIRDPMRVFFAMPTRAELEQARIEVEPFVQHEIDWYDGSIRALDAEIGRLLETLDRLGLAEDTLVAVISDHGEEFLEHGRHYHGQSVYGELTRVPLILRWPAALPAGIEIAETVQTIDLMPTLLELSGIDPPAGLQGQSLVPLFAATAGVPAEATWQRRPAVAEKPRTPNAIFAPPPHDTESVALVLDGWKLIHNRHRAADTPEYELYRHETDPLDRVDVAAEHPEVVERLAALLERWRQRAEAERIAADEETERGLSAEELERLRSLGYI